MEEKPTCCETSEGVAILCLFCMDGALPGALEFKIPCAIGCRVPSGSRRHAISCEGRPMVTGPDRMDAF